MRLRAIDPATMSPEQRRLHDEMAPVVAEHLQGFVSSTDGGALIGPFAPMIAFPAWGAGMWAQTKTLIEHTGLPKPAHEVAILVTGTAHGAAYELYAHERVADDAGLAESKIATIVAGQRPADLDAEEAAAYDVAAALARGGPVPDPTYLAARSVLGGEGVAELIFLVAAYSSVSVLLNGFAMPVPDGAV